MLHFQVTPASGVPNYRQIMDQVAYYVASGNLKPGDSLPSIRELASRLTLNPSTIVKAFNELAHAGVIELRQGKGAFITNGVKKLTPAEIRKALRTQAQKLAVEANQLGISRGALHHLLDEEISELEKKNHEHSNNQ